MKLIFDSTTSLRWAYEEPVGTLRVERVLLSELDRLVGADTFVFANCDQNRFVHAGQHERDLMLMMARSPLQRLKRDDAPDEIWQDSAEGMPLANPASRSRFLQRHPAIKRAVNAVLERYPRELREPARLAAVKAYVGMVESIRFGSRALRARMTTGRASQGPAATIPAIDHANTDRERIATDFSGCTDLLTVANGWDYLGYESLARMRDEFGIRIHGFVHDLIAVDQPYFFHDPKTSSILHRHYAELAHLCATLVCNSHATAAALEHFIDMESLPKPKISVSQLGAFVGAEGSEHLERPEGAPEGSFVMFVSTIEIRKNHRMLLRVWREAVVEAERAGLGFPMLLIIGRVGWGVQEVMNMIETDDILSRYVRVLSGISDPQLGWLYANCLFSVYPSIIEGWGLPISEAMAQGRPVLHSSDPAQIEASQGLMPTVHPDDFMGWKREIHSLVSDGARRTRLERAIATHFKPRNRQQFAQDLLDAISG